MSTRSFNIKNLPSPPQEDIEAVKSWLSSHDKLPIIVEVGAGVGLHAIRKSQENPDKLILAIERTKDKFLKLKGRADSHQLDNLFALHAEATVFLPHIFKSEDISEYYFLYPNPYPKASQKNLRWGHSPFMHFVYDSLSPTGMATFATNIESYKEELVERIPLYGFELVSAHEIDKNQRPRTHFEKKYLARNESCYNIVFKKNLNNLLLIFVGSL